MRKLVFSLAAALVSLLSLASIGQSATWLRDVDHALSVAQVQQRPIMLFVSMDGCKYCDKMIASTLRHPHIDRTLGAQFVPIVIKGSERPDLMRQLNIRSFPTTVLVSPDGEVLDLMTGYIDAARLHQRLERVPGTLAARAAAAGATSPSTATGATPSVGNVPTRPVSQTRGR